MGAANIYARINEVRKKVEYVKKDAHVDSKYWAVTRLTHSNVVITDQVTAKGLHYIRYEGRYDVDFVNVDEPTDKVTVVAEAHALDQGDKAPGKAVSYATKYAMLKLFSIETGEDEEGRMHEPGIEDEEYNMHLAAMEAATDAVALERAWKAAVAACNEKKDAEAYKRLKAVAAARGKKLKAVA
jgi:hypothetical protein